MISEMVAQMNKDAEEIDIPEKFVKSQAPEDTTVAALGLAQAAVGEEQHVRNLEANKALVALGFTEAEAASLRIGVCMSGGGMRAFYESLGFMAGLETTIANGRSLLDAVQYSSVLSGSSWMQWTFLASDHATFASFAKSAEEVDVNTGFLNFTYGSFLSDMLGKWGRVGVEEMYAVYLSTVLGQLKTGKKDGRLDGYISKTPPKPMKPYPIATFIELNGPETANVAHLQASWYEVTPHRVAVASPHDPPKQMQWIPTTAFGQKFNKNGTIHVPPRFSLDRYQAQDDIPFLMAITGSAWAATMGEIKDFAKGTKWESVLGAWAKFRGDDAHVFNPSLHGFHTGHAGDRCKVRDAGMSVNLPFLPLLQRECNIILVKDASAENREEGKQMPRTGQTMRERANQWLIAWATYFPGLHFEEQEAIPSTLGDEIYCFKVGKAHVFYVPRLTDFETGVFVYAKNDRVTAMQVNSKLMAEKAPTLLAKIKKFASELAPTPH